MGNKYFAIAALILGFLCQVESTGGECKESKRTISKNPELKEEIACLKLARGATLKLISRFSKGKQTGLYEGFWPNGQKECLFTYKNGTTEDSGFSWDSLGTMISRANYRHGKIIGKMETWYENGKPKAVKTYSVKGIEDGPTTEWWPNGNLKMEGLKKNKTLISATEYYLSGKPKIKYATKYETKPVSAFKIKYISGESWAPNGKSCGKIENGNGEWLVFPSGADSTETTTFREVYKDSLAIKIDEADSATVAAWTN